MSAGPPGADDLIAAVGGQAPEAILITDGHGEVLSASAQAARVLGASREALCGGRVSELLQTAGLTAISTPVILAGEEAAVVRIRTGADREPEAAELLAAVVRSSAEAILSMDLSGLITSWNAGAERMYGYSSAEAIGQSAMMLVDDEHRSEMEDVLARVRQGEVVEALQTRRMRKSGETILVSVSASPVRDRHGDIVGVAKVARDMTERALIEDELRRSNRDLEQFAYVASHDLSEPLRVIAGFVDLLARRYRGRLDEDADRFIDFIVSGVERLQTLIDDLLLYSRAGRGQTERRPVDVGEVVRDVLWALGPQLRERDVEVSVAQMPTVMAERGMLRQIFQNLIANAIKFGDPGRPYVQIRAEREPGAWRFEIEDNGSGIEPRHAERVFEMFQRLHGREVPGSGIGLAIVKRLTERLGGRVAVGPAVPKGSIFTVTLPDRARPL